MTKELFHSQQTNVIQELLQFNNICNELLQMLTQTYITELLSIMRRIKTGSYLQASLRRTSLDV